MEKGRSVVRPLLLIVAILMASASATLGKETQVSSAAIHGEDDVLSVGTIGVEEFFTASMACDPTFLSAWIEVNESRFSDDLGRSWVYSLTMWGCDSAVRGSISAKGETGVRLGFSYKCDIGIEDHVQWATLGIEVPLPVFANVLRRARPEPSATSSDFAKARLARAEGEAVVGALRCLRRAQIASVRGDMSEAHKVEMELALRLGQHGREGILRALRMDEFDSLRSLIGTVANSDVEVLCSEWIRRDPNVIGAMIDYAAKPRRGLAELIHAASLVATAEQSTSAPGGTYAIGFALDGSRVPRDIGTSREAFEARVEAERTRSAMCFIKLFEEVIEAQAACECLHGAWGMEAEFLEALLRLEECGVRLLAGIGMLPHSFVDCPHMVPAWRISD
ncbi:MAG: hypothetical protein PHP20_03070 [Firmicutes bacterium]|nr:hypothetical protein [Bacillota bacterium]MDD4336433.1 hypothetical protein [Bacillota bacterium]MDD4792021.1 hypothetical protein [Bacillota bacterium]